MKHYHYGIRKEREVAQLFRGKGAGVKRSPASRGSADLDVKFRTGTKWRVQVKASRYSEPASPSRRDPGRLKQSSAKRGATAVVAKVSGAWHQIDISSDWTKAYAPFKKKALGTSKD